MCNALMALDPVMGLYQRRKDKKKKRKADKAKAAAEAANATPVAGTPPKGSSSAPTSSIQ